MTIGERIKWFRSSKGVTQAKLAELSGIHPISIRKYETNKMAPQLQQIDRIAEALGVSTFAITGIENNIKLESSGDFLGLMVMLIKSHIISIEGERQADGGLKSETVEFKVNSAIAQFFDMNVLDSELDADSIAYRLNREEVLQKLLDWEQIYYCYKTAKATNFMPHLSENLKDRLDKAELELQCLNN